MSKERFEHLHSLVEPLIKKQETRFRKSTLTRERLVITLHYLSSGCSQQNLNFSFLIGRTTVRKIVAETCDAIYEALAPIYLRPPNTKEEWKEIIDQYMEMRNMPHVIGALDGKHIAMDCPKGSGTQDYNYKGFYSLVLLAVCDAKYNFTMVDVGQWRLEY